MSYQELEVGEEEQLSDDFITKELISSFKAHIATLENEIQRLRLKYEPSALGLENLSEKYNPPPQKQKLTTMTQIIQELERRTAIKAGVVND